MTPHLLAGRKRKMTDERGRYQRYREDIWMLQVRNRVVEGRAGGANQVWCPTGPRWFSAKGEALKYMREEAIPMWPHLEYRVRRYRPA